MVSRIQVCLVADQATPDPVFAWDVSTVVEQIQPLITHTIQHFSDRSLKIQVRTLTSYAFAQLLQE